MDWSSYSKKDLIDIISYIERKILLDEQLEALADRLDLLPWWEDDDDD